MRRLTRKISVNPEIKVSSVWLVPDNYDQQTGIVIAHGAGSDMNSPFVSYVHRTLVRHGCLTVKFNFPYKEQARSMPDRPAVLQATWRSITRAVRADAELAPRALYLSGKSLGGRMASMVAAEGEPSDGLIFFGYPLHPPRRPDQLRSEHLSAIDSPMLFIQGTRDALCDLALLMPVLSSLPGAAQLHKIDGGDHSFKVPKHACREEREVWNEIVEICAEWIRINTNT